MGKLVDEVMRGGGSRPACGVMKANNGVKVQEDV